MPILDSYIDGWNMDEASGNALSVSGNNDLTETGGTIGSAGGLIGNARVLVAADTENFAHADNSDLSVGNIDFTLQAWVNLSSLAFAPIISKSSGGIGEACYLLWYQAGLDRFQFRISPDGSSISTTANADNFGSPSTATWYLLHAWHDSVAGRIGISVNGGTADTADTPATGVFDGSGDFLLGLYSETGTYLDGMLDEVHFWKRVLTSAERTKLYNGGAGLAHPFPSTGNRRRRVLM